MAETDTDSQVPENEQESLAPPPLGQELATGRWTVRLIDGEAKITEDRISGKQVWRLFNRRVMVEFNRRGEPIKDAGGLFAIWLGSLSKDVHLLPINYTDWRKVPSNKKDMAWKIIQSKFWFDNPNKRKKYALSALGSRCKDLKQRLWRDHRRDTIEESIKERPSMIPEDQWTHFVHIQFTEKATKMRERNIRSRSKLKISNTSGRKSFARKADEMGSEDNNNNLKRKREEGNSIHVLPFEKKSPVWKTFEAMEVFVTIPQNPHFSPLLETRESSREMFAVGMMHTFAGLVKEVEDLRLETPISTLNSLHDSFTELEEHGFDVKVPLSRISKLLSFKDKEAMRMVKLKDVEKEIEEKEREKVEIEENILELRKRKEEGDKELGDVWIQFQTIVSAPWSKD